MHLMIKAKIRPDLGGRVVEVEGIAGSHLLMLLGEAKALGSTLECGVCFSFNGKEAWIWPHQDPRSQAHLLWKLWGWGEYDDTTHDKETTS